MAVLDPPPPSPPTPRAHNGAHTSTDKHHLVTTKNTMPHTRQKAGHAWHKRTGNRWSSEVAIALSKQRLPQGRGEEIAARYGIGEQYPTQKGGHVKYSTFDLKIAVTRPLSVSKFVNSFYFTHMLLPLIPHSFVTSYRYPLPLVRS